MSEVITSFVKVWSIVHSNDKILEKSLVSLWHLGPGVAVTLSGQAGRTRSQDPYFYPNHLPKTPPFCKAILSRPTFLQLHIK